MKKKILYLLLATTVVCVCIGGCGKKKEKEEDKKPVIEQTQKEDETNKKEEVENKGLDCWEEKKMELPKLEDGTKREVAVTEKTKINMYKAYWNFDFAEMKDIVKNNKLVTDNYILAEDHIERMDGERYTDIGERVSFDYEDSVVGAYKKNNNDDTQWFNDFTFELCYQTELFDGAKSSSVSFHNIKLDKKVQKEMYTLLSKLYGKNIAEYLVFAKDIDGKTADDKILDEKGCMSDTIEAGILKYHLVRNVSVNKEDENYVTFIVRADVNENLGYSRFSYYDNEYTTKYGEMKYKVSDFFKPENIGNTDYTTFSTFADKYMNIGPHEYFRTILDNTMFRIVHAENGVSRYECSFEAMKGCSDISKLISPVLDINYEVIEKDGNIIDSEIQIEGNAGFIHINEETDAEKQSAYSQLIDVNKQQIQALFPGLDTTQMSYANYDESGNLRYTTTYTLNGLTYDVSVECKVGISMADVYMAKFEVDLEYDNY